MLMGILLLQSCKRQGSLQSDDVLRKAVTAGSQLQSADFDAKIDFTLTNAVMPWKGSLHLTGAVANGGRQSDVTAHAVVSASGKSPQNIQGDARLISDADQQYFTVTTLNAQPELPLVTQLQKAAGTWWHTASPQSSPEEISPDPVMLKAQASVVKVTQDHGLERVRGHDAYHYSVVLDPQKLVEFMKTLPDQSQSGKLLEQFGKYDVAGELWINAESFALERGQWVISAKDQSGMQMHISADFEHQNDAQKISPPKEFQEFSGQDMFNFMPMTLPNTSASSHPAQ